MAKYHGIIYYFPKPNGELCFLNLLTPRQTHFSKPIKSQNFNCKQQFGSTKILAFLIYCGIITRAGYKEHVGGHRKQVEVEGLMPPRYN